MLIKTVSIQSWMFDVECWTFKDLDPLNLVSLISLLYVSVYSIHIGLDQAR